MSRDEFYDLICEFGNYCWDEGKLLGGEWINLQKWNEIEDNRMEALKKIATIIYSGGVK